MITGRIERLQKDYEIGIRWIAFPLHPEIPEEGLTLEELFKYRSANIDQLMGRLKRAADEAGLPLSKRKKTYNSRLAQELAKWAESEGKGDELHNALFRAYFVDGKNIGKIHELFDLAESASLLGKPAQKVLETRAFRKAVDFDWSRSREMGVTAVPTSVINKQAVMGAQPYEVLERLMEVNNVKKRDRSP